MSSFKVTAEAGGARAGMLFGTQPTPACVVLTRNGAVPYLTPAQLNQLVGSVAEPAAAAASAPAAPAQAPAPQLLHVCALDLCAPLPHPAPESPWH